MKTFILFSFLISILFSSSIYAQIDDTLKSRLSSENQALKDSINTLKTQIDSLKIDNATVTSLRREVDVLRKIMRQYVGIIDSLNTRIFEIEYSADSLGIEVNDGEQESEWQEPRNELGEDPPMYFDDPYRSEPYPDEASAFDKDGNPKDVRFYRELRVPFEQGNISVSNDCIVELTVFADESGNINRVRHIAAGTTTNDPELIKAIVSEVRENVKFVSMNLGEGVSLRHALLIRLSADKK